MTFTYTPKGVCSRRIRFDIEDGCIRNLVFEGGCHGNTQGLSRLAEGMQATELVERLAGIRCGMRRTSCPDQLSIAVKQALEQQ